MSRRTRKLTGVKKMPEKKGTESGNRTELFKKELPSDAEISDVVINKLVELGDTREEAEIKLVKWNREHGI